MDRDAVLLLQGLQVGRVIVQRQRRVGGAGCLDAVLQDRLEVLRQVVEEGRVEQELEALAGLVVGRQHVVLGHVLGAEAHVGRRVVELEGVDHAARSEEHTSELQSLMSNSYAVFCMKKKTNTITTTK